MRSHRARTLIVAIATASVLACSLVRSLDGFDDEFGKDAAPPGEAGGPESGRDAEGVDAGISCSRPEVMWTGGVTSLTGPYLYGMAQDEAHLYVVGGAYAGDAAANGDGGFALQIDKAPPFTASFVATQIDQPTAIVTTSQGIFYSALYSIFHLEPDGGVSTPVKTLTPANINGVITDLTGDDAGLYLTTGLSPDKSRLHFLPWTTGFLQTQPYPGAARVLTDKDWVFVTRRATDAGPGLVRFDRATALDDAATGCAMDTERVLGVGLDGERIAWAGTATEFAVAQESACDPPVRATDVGSPMAVAVGKRGVFVRYAGAAGLYTFGREKIAGCTFSLVSSNEAIATPSKGTQAAVFDGDYVYFQTPQRVYRMRVAAP